MKSASIQTSDIGKLSSKAGELQEAERIIRELTDLAHKMLIPPRIANKFINQARLKCVYKFFGKVKQYTEASYSSFAHSAFDGFSSGAGPDAQASNPFQQMSRNTDTVPKEKSSKPSSSSDNMHDQRIEYDEAGAAKPRFQSILRKSGFEVDKTVRNRKTGRASIIR